MKRKIVTAELLIRPDGKVLAHNLTPEVAAVLRELNPDDEQMKQRAARPRRDELSART
jgi:hypothetical protein